MIGFNCADNRIDLTVQQHAQAHALLYEINGIEYDKIASMTLLGLIGKEEAHRRAASLANKGDNRRRGTKHTEETKARIADAHIGMRHSKETRKRISEVQIGRRASDEARRNNSIAQTGKVLTAEHRKKIGDAHRRNHETKHN
jgi:NUMOD3 motif